MAETISKLYRLVNGVMRPLDMTSADNSFLVREIKLGVDGSATSLTKALVDGLLGRVDNLVTLSGVAADATHLGTFSGSTIADNSTVKSALQALEGASEVTAQRASDLISLSGVAANATDLGTFTGSTIPDGQTVKGALQSLEGALETVASQGGSALQAHLDDTVDAHDASAISFASTADIVATDVQAAIVEVRSDALSYTDTRETAIRSDFAAADALLDGRLDVIEGADTVVGSVSNAIKQSKDYTNTKVAALVDSSPALLDTLNELAAALGDDPNFATTVATNISNEATARANADTQIRTDFASADATNLQAAKDYADAAVLVEKTRAEGVESGLNTRLTTAEGEIDALQLADIDLDSRIDALEAGSAGTLRSDLASTANGKGASLVGVEDSAANFTATTVEGVLAELAGDISSVSTAAQSAITTVADDLAAHIVDAVDAHDASAISFSPGASGLLSSDVNAAIIEVQTNMELARDDLVTAISDEATARTNADNALDARLDVIEGTGAGSVAKALVDAKAYTDARETAIRSDFAAADSSIRTDFAAADSSVRSDFAAADALLDGRLDVIEGSGAGSIVKAQSDAQAYADGLIFANVTNKLGANSGIAQLDAQGKLKSTQIPAIAITSTFVVASEAAMLALTVQEGDVAVRTDLHKSFIVSGVDGSVIENWTELQTPTDSVASVNGQTGIVVLDTDDVAEGSLNKYFTDGRAQTAVVASSIVDGDTTHSPSGEAVYEALALKANGSALTTLEGRVTTAESNINQNTLAIDVINGLDTEEGSIAYAVKGLKDSLAYAGDQSALSGAEMIAIRDVGGVITASTVEGAIDELYQKIENARTELKNIFVAGSSGVGLETYDLCYIDDVDGKVYKATNDASVSDKFNIVGMNVLQVGINSDSTIQSSGLFTSSVGLVKGKPVFLGTNGLVTQTPPTTSGTAVVRLGVAISSTQYFFFPQVVGIN